MITDHVSNLETYAGLGKHFPTAVGFVQQSDLVLLTPGRHEIDGENVYALVVDRELTSVPTCWEAHEKYADIHLILSGSETVWCCPLSRLCRSLSYDASSDSAMLEGLAGDAVHLLAGEFFIALPQDIHLPNGPGTEGSHSRKLILKVRVDDGRLHL